VCKSGVKADVYLTIAFLTAYFVCKTLSHAERSQRSREAER